MNRMEENLLKKSEFNGLVATVMSTITILIGIFIGGVRMKDAIVEDIRTEFRAEIKSQIKDFEARQALRDREQDFRIDDFFKNNLRK